MIRLIKPEMEKVLLQYGIKDLQQLTVEDALKISKRYNITVNDIFEFIVTDKTPEVI